MVLATHFGATRIFPGAVVFATMGVNLFFVISGFLITLILLDLKEVRNSQNTSLFQLLKTFYIRRMLRIFPIYYLIILVSLILGVYPIYEVIGWLLTYTYNIKASFGEIDSTLFSHFWSLAVEEQFYLFCPLFVLIIPKKHLLKFFITMISLGILSRFLLNNFLPIDSRDGLVGYQFTICCFDALGFGGLLAYLFFYFQSELNQFIRKYFWLFGAVFVGFLLVEFVFVPTFGGGATLSRFLFSATCFGIIGYASLENGFGGIVGRFLENSVVLYLGKISYGIYVYHIFIGRIFTNPERFAVESYNFSGTIWSISIENLYLRVFLRLALTILIAVISWHFFELPINRLKNKFPYPKKLNKDS